MLAILSRIVTASCALMYVCCCEQERDGFDGYMDDDLLTEEQVERLEERLEAAQSEQKNLFLIIFQVTPLTR